ncbi:MAG: FtsQ-type POTRA domain-containing protein [Proteobacteria bacterium]|nr:FtsQ-type POTRA domain-containing protein [Pseudomonadota bacterium]
MKASYRQQWEAKKNRLKRRAGDVLRETGRAILLTGAVAGVAFVFLAAFDLMIRSPFFSVRETVVRGCKELTEKDIIALAAVRSAPNILSLNLEAMARRIRVNPWIRHISIGREFPGRLVIVIQERKPVALLEKGNALYLLDNDGTPFKKQEAGEVNDLPVLTGLVRAGRVDEALLKSVLALLNTLAAVKDVPPIGVVSEIHGNETFGLSLFTDAGLCLQLGFDGYETKLKRLTPVMEDLDKKNLKSAFLLIDLNDPAKINVQRRNIMGPEGPAGKGKGYRM